ncbi:MAG TPA: glutamate synthase large subunit [Candidatus Dormibacteraeota bacterium]|nr:glutamate synthase large subunit [Candidatus Dormibacteraeota bacterium]
MTQASAPQAPGRPGREDARNLRRGRLAWAGDLPSARAACGMGFVSTPELGHEAVRLGALALARLAHRGGLDADGKSGDGAGLLIQVPQRLLGGEVAVASLFEWDESALGIVTRAVSRAGLQVIEWRRVPVDPTSLGDRARDTMPGIWHALIARSGFEPDEWEPRLDLARRAAERDAEATGVRMYLPSCSSRTLVYKGLMAGTRLADFYLDLQNPACESRLAVFHQRYSTNTMPDWRLAQPFRMVAHNGEINTVGANRAWMRAREAELESDLRGVIWPEGSDSASLDNALELLVRRGWEVSEALMSLVPDAWEGRGDLAPAVRDFYRYQSTKFEPWDGPAALAFSDGVVVGAALDRNGLRPLRWARTAKGMVAAASEAGVVTMEPADVVERGRLGPGQMLLVDTRDSSVLRDADAKERAAARHDYGLLADRVLVPVPRRHIELEPLSDLGRLQRIHGWGFEDVKMVVEVMAETGAEPVYSMGDDIPIAPLGRTPRRIYGYLRQRFAQVTNPAIDPLREKAVMSLRTLLGARSRTLEPEGGAESELSRRHHPAVPQHARLLELESPVLAAGELTRVLEEATVLDATCAPERSLASELKRLQTEAEQAGPIIAISDRRADLDPARVPIPMALAVGAVHEHLLAAGRRMSTDIVAIAGDVVDVHDLACLVTIGASAVHPYLAMATAGPDGEAGYRKALEAGLLKVMAKMGISCAASYRGGLVLEALGLGAEVMQTCFPSMPSRIGGADLADLDELMRARMADAGAPLPDHGRVRFRKTGEHHAYNPLAVRTAQKAVEAADADGFREWLRASHMDRPQSLRDLLDLQTAETPAPLDEVEPAREIVKRFVSTAMSLGALSPEAHEALAIAMNTIGARSNSGEGGEDPEAYEDSPIRRDNRVKQVASARFGVTPAYLKRADELEIKIAQGSKPGEGGQLPGLKVTSLIARLRHAQPGMQLISPPPHHDIYSIEDLAQLIHDLKTVNSRARVGVKLVAESGVGTIAAGVVKARADYVLISGHDGGTGASPLSSIKNAGVPWELGLAETQQVLVANRLRERVSLRTDGGLRSGRDIVVAALLGAEEFGFGTGVLVALGCDMARQCHLNTCPTGIATQREDLRAKFTGRPEHVINHLMLIAEDVREHLSLLGARSMDEIVGRVELLAPAGDCALDLSLVLGSTAATEPRRRVWPRNGEPPGAAPAPGRIDNSQRTVGASLGVGESRAYSGSAGQSFGAFLDAGVDLTLDGEAQDYVGKGMGGGSIVIRPPSGDGAVDPVLAGNTIAYGATGGRLFVAGRVGERCCVRNSGATVVVEGAGDHFCEYMTGGVAVSLGSVGWNAGAGMTGGTAYLIDWRQLNPDSVVAREVPAEDEQELRGLIEEHLRRTDSTRASALLADWATSVHKFRQIVPVAVVKPPEAVPAPQQEETVRPVV